ncbi:IclR family transcriptional regulator [Roseomonas sp. BN140053]|uniref:IclR family transcriptional regulator n=1 Tax=Roseomonas sp. BN140053 TaxID=3391898 RepID=UPI0039EAAE17
MSKIVDRTLDFLELFAEHKKPLSLSDISRLLRIPVSSCHDVLQALQARGYLYEIAPRAGYYPTLRLRDLAQTIAAHDPVLQRAEAALAELRDALDESVSLARINGLRATYLLVFEPSHLLRFLVRVGDDARSLHATSAGKALLGSLDAAALENFLAGAALPPMTERTITDKDALRRDIAEAQRRGWYLNREESVTGATTLSARFAWNGSHYIVTVAGPASRMEGKLDRAAVLLAECCRRLEMRAGPDAARR